MGKGMQEIVNLPRETYEGVAFPFEYESDYYYDVVRETMPDGFCVSFVRKPFEARFVMQAEDALFEQDADDSSAWGIMDGGTPIALLEISPVRWNGTLRILNIRVSRAHRRHGLGKLLMDHAKAVAVRDGHRAIVLETQSCNDPAISFYLAQGFALSGFDAYAYTNDDVARREVRLEMTWLACKEEA